MATLGNLESLAFENEKEALIGLDGVHRQPELREPFGRRATIGSGFDDAGDFRGENDLPHRFEP